MRPSSRSRAAAPTALSLEAALDEERLEVLAALEGSKRSASPFSRNSRPMTPPPYVRSMLDIDNPTPRHGSIAGIGVGITAGASPSLSRKTALDPSDPSTWTSRHTPSSANTSPDLIKTTLRQRSTSDTGDLPKGLPKIPDDDKKSLDSQYQFDMSQGTPAIAASRRTTQDAKKSKDSSGSSMGAAPSGEFTSLHVGLPKDAASGRHNSTAGITGQSKSPSSRLRRPTSPTTSGLGNPPGKYVTDSGKVISMNKAYRRIPNKAKGDDNNPKMIGGSEDHPEGRVQEDELDPEDEEANGSSEEEYQSSSDELSESGAPRGRHRGRQKDDGDLKVEDDDTEEAPQSQSAAAEEERKAVWSQHPVKSLLEPQISITSPSGENIPAKKPRVHPTNSYEQPASVASSQGSSDADPDLADISKARKLGINVSAVDTTVPDRVCQILLRGDWGAIQQEADEERRRQRTYLVASDLSEEAVYALEWTIGTILRDGDTLIAMYAIEDENAGSKTSEKDQEALQAEGARAAQHTELQMEDLTRKTEENPIAATSLNPTIYSPATETDSVAGSVDARRVSKAHMERLRAADSLRATCLKLVRKTRLQVRIMVEVIHCKSPKHLITGAIDELEPTLVVLGSRGRSALKGTLLGSMSNYIVTKSSVPVMVARKRLKKHIKATPLNIRLTNNLSTPIAPTKRMSLKDANVEQNIYRRRS